MDAIRATFQMEPRASRAFVTGSQNAGAPSIVPFGFSHSDDGNVDYASYPATSNGVYASINARTRALSSLPIKLYSKRLDKDGKRVEIVSGPARELLDSVNPFWTFSRWLDMTEQSLCVWGESFTFYEKRGNRPVEMWWARADHVTVHPHPTEYISHFTYDNGSGKPIRFEREETLWLRYPNVANQYKGLSPLGAARLAADTSSAAMKSNYNVFRNGLTGAGIVVPQGTQNLSEDQAKAVATDLNRRFRGVENAHKIGVLRFGVDIKQLSLTPKDAEFLGMMNLSLEDIARAFSIPIDKIGGKRTYQNVDDSEKVFWQDCILPEARFIAAEITEQLLPLFGGDMVAEFDESDISVLHEAETAKWERWQGQITSGARLINEYRAEEGLEPVPWGDVWWMQNTMTPISSDEKPVGAMPPALAAAAGIESEPEEEPAETEEPDEETERIRATRAIEYGSADHLARLQRSDEALETWERRIGTEVALLMQDQRQSVLAQLRQRSRGAEDMVTNPFDESRWIKTFRTKMRPVLQGVIEGVAELAQDELGVSFGFNVLDPRVIRAIETQVQSFATEVNQTTWNMLRESLADGLTNGETIDQLADRVEAVMADRIRSSKEAIAITESVKASTNGTLETWRQSGVVAGKEWVAAMDSRTRETHRHAHGQIVGIDDVFTVGNATGMGPGQMSSAKESVRCRCTIAPVLDVEMPGGMA